MIQKILVIGAGLYGCTIANLFASIGIHVILIDKRQKIGGNCSSTIDEYSLIEVHDYGPHIFHTSNEKIWNYVNSFSKFNSYQHHVITEHDNHKYFLPFNLSLINQFYDKNLSPLEAVLFLKSKIKQIDNPKNLEEKAISLIGEDIYNAFIKGYTFKQWMTPLTELPASIIDRIPFRFNYDINYYDDLYQGIPIDGYQNMIENMVKNKNITILKNNNEFKTIKDIERVINDYDLIFYSGQLDKLFDYVYGQLEWRSLNFITKKLDCCSNYQGISIINYPDIKIPYTRINEYKWYHPERKYDKDNTIITFEYPEKYTGKNEPYYPINIEKNNDLFLKYYFEVKSKYPKLIIGGRLGLYKYFDMDDVIDLAIKHFQEIYSKISLYENV